MSPLSSLISNKLCPQISHHQSRKLCLRLMDKYCFSLCSLYYNLFYSLIHFLNIVLYLMSAYSPCKQHRLITDETKVTFDLHPPSRSSASFSAQLGTYVIFFFFNMKTSSYKCTSMPGIFQPLMCPRESLFCFFKL